MDKRNRIFSGASIRAPASILALAVSVMLLGACSYGESHPNEDVPSPWTWEEAREGAGFRPLAEGLVVCSECLAGEQLAVLGDTDGPGYLDMVLFNGEVVRDSLGNFWVSQRGTVKVFGPTGDFIAEVGRPGQGPMEFQYATPVYADTAGRVHILDSINNRETIVGPDFELYSDRRLPAGFFEAAAPLANGKRYVLQMWVETADRIGFPLHISEGPKILHSFGALADGASGLREAQTAQRYLATDAHDHIFSAELYNYSIEAWTDTGQRIIGLSGPPLNDTEFVPGPWSATNPPPTQIRGIDVDDAGRLWVARLQVKRDWLDSTVERIRPDGSLFLALKDDDFGAVYQTRIDVIDLNTASIVASSDQDGVFTKFLGDNLMVAMRILPDGNSALVISRLALIP